MHPLIVKHLGRAAMVAPSEAVRKAIRKHLLADPLAQPKDAGAQGSPRNYPGPFPDAYAVHHGIVTPDEMRPRWDTFMHYERDVRGLGLEKPPDPDRTVMVPTHFTVTQHYLIAAMHPVAKQRKLATKQALQLVGLLLDEPVCKPGHDEVNNVRVNAWALKGLLLEAQAMGALHWAALLAIMDRTRRLMRTEPPTYMENTASLKDKRHGFLGNCTWMQGLHMGALAELHLEYPSPELVPLIRHGVRCMEYAQDHYGRFYDDYGWAEGELVVHTDGKETMDPWVWPQLVRAKEALGDAWTMREQGVLDLCLLRWAAMNRMRPTDSGWRDPHSQSVAIGVASEWGWRA